MIILPPYPFLYVTTEGYVENGLLVILKQANKVVRQVTVDCRIFLCNLH